MLSIYLNSLDFLTFWGNFYLLNLSREKNRLNIERTKINLKMILFISFLACIEFIKFHSFNQNGLHFGLLVHFNFLTY